MLEKQKFGKLIVLDRYTEPRRTGNGNRYVAKCVCDCGSFVEVEIPNLKSGNTTQCNDCAKISRGKNRRTHGHSYRASGGIEIKSYYTWQAMKRRCLKEYDKRFADYGGRGITICDAWIDSYEAFLGDMGLPPSMKHQIDRIDNDGNYKPENCAWVSRKKQSRNKRNNRHISANGVTLTLVEWTEKTGMHQKTISSRIKRGWTPEEALGLTPRIKKTWKEMN